MLIPYHRQILREALESKISAHALKIITRANAKQDGLRGQIGHDEYHFDNNAFDKSYAYIAKNRTQIFAALKSGFPKEAWEAFGRLSHTAQDFYAHSNYIPLWLAKFDEKNRPSASEVVHNDESILRSKELRSGKLYYPLELLSYIPPLKKYVMPRLPKDSHAWMNIDSQAQGEIFEYTFMAAVKTTQDEWDKVLAKLSHEEKGVFQDIKAMK